MNAPFKSMIEIEEMIRKRQEKYKPRIDPFHRLTKKEFFNHLSDCSPTEKCVYLTIGLHVNPKTGVCWPSIRTIAKLLKLSTKTIQIAIVSLKKKGFLKVIRRGRNNLYSLT